MAEENFVCQNQSHFVCFFFSLRTSQPMSDFCLIQFSICDFSGRKIMSESNGNGRFDRNLEKVFRTHEHRIEDELHKMSQSFEKCAQSQDIALMSNFFEYLNYR